MWSRTPPIHPNPPGKDVTPSFQSLDPAFAMLTTEQNSSSELIVVVVVALVVALVLALVVVTNKSALVRVHNAVGEPVDRDSLPEKSPFFFAIFIYMVKLEIVPSNGRTLV